MQEKSEKNFFHPKNPQTQESMHLAPEKFLACKNQCISPQKKISKTRIHESRPRKKSGTQESMHLAPEKKFQRKNHCISRQKNFSETRIIDSCVPAILFI